MRDPFYFEDLLEPAEPEERPGCLAMALIWAALLSLSACTIIGLVTVAGWLL
jgi:hypothetical protein